MTKAQDRPPCEPCTIAATIHPEYRWFDPACLYCGARLLQSLRDHPTLSQADRRARMAAALDRWELHGHDRNAMRELAKGPRCTGPAKDSASDRRPSTKHRSAGAKSG